MLLNVSATSYWWLMIVGGFNVNQQLYHMFIILNILNILNAFSTALYPLILLEYVGV
jgi:hypothetical protein